MKLPKLQYPSVFLVIVSVVAGITVYFGIGVLLAHRSRPLPKTVPMSISKPSVPKIPPTAINIPKLDKNLPIKSASVSGNTWDMFPDAVAWLATSAVPGRGNVILYAHNWRTLWRDLYLLKPGDPIEIQQENVWKHYVVTDSRDINEHDIKAVLSDKNRLTLYTCDGSFNQKRRVVYADPID
ncbi:MAG: sortase [Candidatus Gottesmanbacteria bacterium]|nr:sortase [Candidatus Gottesmanbacteria bacterium]